MALRIALFGAGRIGQVHVRTLTRNDDAELACVVDAVPEAAAALARAYNIPVSDTASVMADKSIDAVLIASSTDTHADLLEQALQSGKAVFCEKPLDLDLGRARDCLAASMAADTPVMMAFNRRFDPNFKHLKAELDAGEIGRTDLIAITSFDPAPPPIDYIKVSGGLFRDMAIHDFDVACWLMGETPETITAKGSVLVDPEIGNAGDVDTAVITLGFSGGRMANILNSRRAAYGYDQRIEVLGAKGALQAQNVLENTVVKSTANGVQSAKPEHFFLERYMRAYENELNAFVSAVTQGAPIPATVQDGVNALAIAVAAERSNTEQRTVQLREILD